MGADLTASTWFRRESVVLMDDSLVILETEYRKDRMRKILFDQVSDVTVWREFPLGRTLLFIAVLGLPAAIIVGSYWPPFHDTAAYVIVACILGPLLIILLRYFICGKTFIRIGYSGNVREFTFIARPGRMRKFLARLVANIQMAQQEAIRRVEARDAERQSEERSRLAAHAEGPPEPAPPEENPSASVQEA